MFVSLFQGCESHTSGFLIHEAVRRYPLQNNLSEYWCMVDFVRPSFLGTMKEFMNMFANPISNGQCVDSGPADIKLMKERIFVLQHELSGFVQRRDDSVLEASLPSKYEWTIPIRLSSEQETIYKRMIDPSSDHENIGIDADTGLFKVFSALAKVWNHLDLLYSAYMKTSKGDGAEGSANLQKRRVARDELDLDAASAGFDYSWAGALLTDHRPGLFDKAGKFVVLRGIIERCILRSEKVVVFTQSLGTLDVIEAMLRSSPVPRMARAWRCGDEYLRLDGSTPSAERQKMVHIFNENRGSPPWVFLLSTRAGSLGSVTPCVWARPIPRLRAMQLLQERCDRMSSTRSRFSR